MGALCEKPQDNIAAEKLPQAKSGRPATTPAAASEPPVAPKALPAPTTTAAQRQEAVETLQAPVQTSVAKKPAQAEDKLYKLSLQATARYLKIIFDAFDPDHSGNLDAQEVKALMQAFQPDDHSKHLSKKQRKKHVAQPKLQATQAQVEGLFATMDRDGDGLIDSEEFSDFFIALLELKFCEYDDDASGQIDPSELNDFIDTLLGKDKGMIRTLSGDKQKADTKSLDRKRAAYIAKVQQDKDKRVSVDEFVGFSLACLSEIIEESGSKKIPVGLRNLIDLRVTGKGSKRGEQIASKMTRK
jgi:Ca2+-binding EF-hand superfamily protein